MTELRCRMIEDMQLHGLAAKTQQCYVDAVKNLARHYGRSPDRLSEPEVRQFFVHLINEKQVAESTLRVHLYGVKFFYQKTLGRPWLVFDIIRPRRRKKLPVVLSHDEVRRIVRRVRNATVRMCLTTIYSCGLRLSEGTHLRVTEIDSERMLVCVRQGKGGKDRYVPLAQCTLEQLRAYWKTHRSRPWLFPSRDTCSPVSNGLVQKTFKAALRESAVRKDASVHTLRHSYATHLLEQGVNLRVIQEVLGHNSPKTTAIYTHLTRKMVADLQATVNQLMADL